MGDLSKNFSLSEFNSKDGAKMPADVYQNIILLVTQLEIIREYVGNSIAVNSGYRSPSHNRVVGGAPNSYHVKGMASDIRAKGMTHRALYELILQLMQDGKIIKGGISLYPSFVHYDIRGKIVKF